MFDFLKSDHELLRHVNFLKDCKHSYYDTSIRKIVENPYHLEDSVYEHTKRVLNEALKINKNRNNLNLIFAAVFHDIGKYIAREVNYDRKRVRFLGHEGLSYFMCLDYLNGLGTLSKNDVTKISRAIANHGKIFKYFRDLNEHKFESQYVSKLREYVFNFADDFDATLTLDLADSDRKGRILECNHDLLAGEDIIRMAIEDARDYFVVPPQFDDNDREVIFLVGPPCSGKTSFVKSNMQGVLYLSRDELILNTHPDKTYNEAFKIADQDAIDREFDSKFETALKTTNNTIVIDRTNCSEKSRRKYLSKIKNMKYNRATAIVFQTPYSTIMKRNANRKEEGKEFHVELIHNFMKQFSFPSYGEGFTKIEIIGDCHDI